MPHIKSTDVGGPSFVARCREGLNFQPVTDNMPFAYEVDKDLDKFYYLTKQASTPHRRQVSIVLKEEWILILKRTFRPLLNKKKGLTGQAGFTSLRFKATARQAGLT